MSDHELPPDPDLDDLPDEIMEAEWPLSPTGWERETCERIEGPVEMIHLARGFADRRRIDADEEPT